MKIQCHLSSEQKFIILMTVQKLEIAGFSAKLVNTSAEDRAKLLSDSLYF